MDFLVYGIKADKAETVYRLWDKSENIREPGQRIARIRFNHDGEVFVAEVGKPTRPVHHASMKTDQAHVMAIIPGNPYRVFTTAEFGVPSRWAHPYFVAPYDVLASRSFNDLP